MAGRAWTDRDLAELGELLGRGLDWSAIGMRLRRSRVACVQRATLAGIYQPRRRVRRGAAFHETLRRYNSLGYTDTEIAAITGAQRTVVSLHRRRLGLPSNKWSERQHATSGSRRGWFQRGQINGHALDALGFLGETRVLTRRDRKQYQFRIIKVANRGPRSRRWRPFARHVWERLHGPVPAGHIVVHRNGDTLDDEPDNLICIPRSALPSFLDEIRPRSSARRLRNSAAANRRRWQDYRRVQAARLLHQGAMA